MRKLDQSGHPGWLLFIYGMQNERFTILLHRVRETEFRRSLARSWARSSRCSSTRRGRAWTSPDLPPGGSRARPKARVSALDSAASKIFNGLITQNTKFGRTTQNLVIRRKIWSYDSKFGHTMQNSVGRQKIWSYDANFGRMMQTLVVQHNIWLYDTKFGRTMRTSVVRHKFQ
jgi:hypothetical protein